MDAVDAALVELSSSGARLVATIAHPLPTPLRQQLLALCSSGDDELDRLAQTDVEVGRLFADAVQALLTSADVAPERITAIGSHGQTVRHAPQAALPYTVQIGDPNTIAERTGITTVADFRRRDMAAGGQGAPLVPAFHAATLHSTDEDRAVVNIGGMANVTLLPSNRQLDVTGFDTGPGNVLLDIWAAQHVHSTHDAGGQWAAAGTVNPDLLARMYDDPYFRLAPPKSTGREHFNRDWLVHMLGHADSACAPADIQATLAELTARTIADALRLHLPGCRQALVCGGGVHNDDLMARLRCHLPDLRVDSTAIYGLAPDWVEATAFAWLAQRTLAGMAGNLPAVTGARRAVVLGGIYPGRSG